MRRAATAPRTALSDAEVIAPSERDHRLKLHSDEWGSDLGEQWELCPSPARHFVRRVAVQGTDTTHDLLDYIVRFPSAPIYGINRKHDYQLSLDRPNMHTLRVLTRPGIEKVDRVFILHNGLNEADTLRFYYRLADWILTEDRTAEAQPNSACVIAPFPGHLMHVPIHGPFTQTPLSRYLDDAGELFRQFLRYMVEMRWLFSVVADRPAKEWMVGERLLGADAAGRPNPDLEVAMRSEWSTMYEASFDRLAGSQTPRPDRTAVVGPAVAHEDFEDMMNVLRHIVRPEGRAASFELGTHVVGYSLGGFLAQTVFFAWPQVVSSCATICSGGAIRALSPTAFAHREEWQAVLHALRPEVEGSMLAGRLALRDGLVAGMPEEQFGYYQRIFDQVFLQEDSGSYRERLSEYGPRMLFVSGGEDPIVRTEEVLDASPDEGITMLSVASLTHFLAQDPKKGRHSEKDQRDFWLPEIGRLIARAATRSEDLHQEERERAEEYVLARPDERAEPPRRPPTGGLPSPEFEEALDWTLDAISKQEGWLFVCRNSLPPAFLDPMRFTTWGTALHHHDPRIQRYAHGLRLRAAALNEKRDRLTLIVPKDLATWFIESSALFDPHSDAPSGRLSTQSDRESMWEDFGKRWDGCVRQFDAGDLAKALPDSGLASNGLSERIERWQGVKPGEMTIGHLPDVWIGITGESEAFRQAGGRDDTQQSFIASVEQILAEETTADEPDEDDERDDPISQLHRDLDSGGVRIVQVSGAEFNPRYRGRHDVSVPQVIRLLAQCAAALVRSRPGAPVQRP